MGDDVLNSPASKCQTDQTFGDHENGLAETKSNSDKGTGVGNVLFENIRGLKMCNGITIPKGLHNGVTEKEDLPDEFQGDQILKEIPEDLVCGGNTPAESKSNKEIIGDKNSTIEENNNGFQLCNGQYVEKDGLPDNFQGGQILEDLVCDGNTLTESKSNEIISHNTSTIEENNNGFKLCKGINVQDGLCNHFFEKEGLPDEFQGDQILEDSPENLVCDDIVSEYEVESTSTMVAQESEVYISASSVDDELQDLAVICSERVTQMTRTYNDIEAVNRLLEEKERDLELAAKIGQTLLQKNQELTEKNEVLEEQLSQATEKVYQLKHEVTLKDGLLQAFASYEGADTASSDSSPCDAESIGAANLHKRVKLLEDENLQLKLETAQLSAETFDYEEKEAKLVTDCLDQLGEAKQQLEFYRDELMKKTEENCNKKDEITGLLAQIVDLQKKSKTLTLENLDLQKTLEASQDSQRALTKEIAELKDKYDELCELLEDNQEEIRQLRRKQKPQAVKHNYMTSSLLSIPSDSLASELESTYRSDVEYPPGYSPSERKAHSWKIFETVKAAKKAATSSQPPSRRSYSSNASLCSSNLFVPGYSPSSCNISLNHSGESTKNTSNRSSVYMSDGESEISEGYHGDLDSLYGSTTNLGRPGIPGSNDLEAALRRLSMRRANELNEQDYFAEEERKKRERSDTDSSRTTGACRTPDSTLSTGSGLSAFSHMTGSNPYYRLPEKLKIVKPIEGSLTLRHWQQLATPHLGGIFESRPGVQIKGERNLDLEGEVYNISDIEEDDDHEYMAAKRYQDSSTVNTYTNSLVKHPNESHSDEEMFDYADDEMSDVTSVTKCSTPRLATAMNSGGTSTYSMSLGLAAILNERDLASVQEKGPQKTVTSNPARFPSIISDKHFDNMRNKATAITTSASSNAVTMATGSTNRTGVDMNNSGEGPNLLEKLKNTGYSLYGYLGNWSNKSQTSTPCTCSVTTATSNTSATSTTSALSDTKVSNLVKIGPAECIDSPSSTKLSGLGSLLGGGSTKSSGMLGALTDTKRHGTIL